MIGNIIKLENGKVIVEWPNKKGNFWYKLEDQVKEEYIKSGAAEISVNQANGMISFISMVDEMAKADKKASGEKSFGDDITNFETLLDKAHALYKGKFSIRTEIVEDGQGKAMISYANKQAVFKATVTIHTETGSDIEFMGHGDAENIKGDVIKSWLRMAETRSIVRALRFATNNAKVAEEEMPGKKVEKKK